MNQEKRRPRNAKLFPFIITLKRKKSIILFSNASIVMRHFLSKWPKFYFRSFFNSLGENFSPPFFILSPDANSPKVFFFLFHFFLRWSGEKITVSFKKMIQWKTCCEQYFWGLRMRTFCTIFYVRKESRIKNQRNFPNLLRKANIYLRSTSINVKFSNLMLRSIF